MVIFLVAIIVFILELIIINKIKIYTCKNQMKEFSYFATIASTVKSFFSDEIFF